MNTPEVQNSLLEDAKANFDIQEAMNSFIIKKDYFVAHRDGSIFNDYDMGSKPIGEGGFGTVFVGTDKMTGEKRAIK